MGMETLIGLRKPSFFYPDLLYFACALCVSPPPGLAFVPPFLHLDRVYFFVDAGFGLDGGS
jgi:hypothetical protein